MENINILIKNNQLIEALEIINEEISNPKNVGTDKYHELLFSKGRIYIMKYESTKPVDNKLFEQAQKDFAQADNAHMALHSKPHSDYYNVIFSANRIYQNLNRK